MESMMEVGATQVLIAVIAGLACAVLLLTIALARSRNRIEALMHEKHAVDMALARSEAAQAERELAFETMKEELLASRERLKTEFESLAAQVLREREAHFQVSSRDALALLLQPFREQVQAFQQRVNEVHDESLRGHVSLGTEIRRLSEVGLQMSREAETLARALKGDKKVTGNWGEVQLERSLQLAGLERGVHYDTQQRLKDVHGDVRLPDFILKLPDGKHVVLDSKVSLVDYDRALSAASDEERQAALDAHVKAVRNHIDDLARKDYSGLPGIDSPGFVLMFMPIEPAYIEALRHARDLFDHGCRQNVILVSHSTLMPVLKTVSSLWMIARSNEQAQALADRAGEIYNQVAIVAERLKKLGESLETVGRQYNSTVTAVAGQQGLHGKVSRFREVSARANRRMPDLQPLAADFDSQRLGLIVGSAE